jgi:hypothetical protein
MSRHIYSEAAIACVFYRHRQKASGSSEHQKNDPWGKIGAHAEYDIKSQLNLSGDVRQT